MSTSTVRAKRLKHSSNFRFAFRVIKKYHQRIRQWIDKRLNVPLPFIREYQIESVSEQIYVL